MGQGVHRECWVHQFVSTHLNPSQSVSAVQGRGRLPGRRIRWSWLLGVQMTVVWTLRPNG